MKKFGSLKKCMVFICVLLIFSAFCVFAEGEVTKLSVVPTVEGNEVSVAVDYESLSMCGGSFNFIYDNSALRIVSVKEGESIKDTLHFINPEFAENAIRINWVFTTDVPTTGDLIHIKFEMTDGTFNKSDINIEKLKIADGDGNKLDAEFEIVYEGSEEIVPPEDNDSESDDSEYNEPESDNSENNESENNGFVNNNSGNSGSDSDYSPNTRPSSGSVGTKQETVTEQTNTETVMPEPETAVAFFDVKTTDWFYENVKYAVENNLMKGTSETEFSPGNNLTRAMLVAVLYRNEGEPAVSNSASFDDVDSGAYYANAVLWAKENGIVNGITETEFAPDTNITREQIAAIMYRYAQYKGYDVSAGNSADISSYSDEEEISGYAIVSVRYVVGSGLMKGKSLTTLNPKDNATRAEIAAILQRFIENNK